MRKVGDIILYKNDVCIIKEICKNHYHGMDYYIIYPIDDESLKIEVPIENKLGLIKDCLKKDEALEFINNIPNIEPISISDKLIENEYKRLLQTGERENIIKIIKTTYLRNNGRKLSGKKIGEKDDNYFKKAERLLYNELAISLNLSYEDTKQFIIDTLNKKDNR